MTSIISFPLKKPKRGPVIKVLILSIFMAPCISRAENLLKCLGREEYALFKKHETGPLYNLNQALIDEVTSSGNPDLIPEWQKKVCEGKGGASLNLLRLVLIEGPAIFQVTNVNPNDIISNMKRSAMEDFVARSGSLFFTYLSSLQAQAKDPHCLSREIPGLDQFITRYRYLEEDLNKKQLFADKKFINSIFDKIISFDKILYNCEKSMKKPSKTGSRE